MVLQTILFDKSVWTKARARKWLIEHEKKDGDPDIKENFYRFRQVEPVGFEKYRTVPKGNGIEFVYAFK